MHLLIQKQKFVYIASVNDSQIFCAVQSHPEFCALSISDAGICRLGKNCDIHKIKNP